MNPDVAQAIPEIARSGILEQEKASRLLRIARGDLISVRAEIRLLLYLGVLVTSAGAGLLIKQNYDQIGPLAVALAVGLGAAACLGFAIRQAPGFSWGEVPSPSMVYEYLLLLGLLLGVADLAFIEVQFTPLGANWPWHLLIASILMACIAIRHDSRTIFSLALSTFAAWRGVSVSLIEMPIWRAYDESVRWNAVCCGLLFLFLGRFLLRSRKKPHFEPVAVYLGWLLVLGSLVSGGPQYGAKGVAYILLLIGTGGYLACHSFRKQRFSLFVAGVLAVFIGLIETVLKSRLGFEMTALSVCFMAVALIALLWKAHRKIRGTR
jgi:hypothetical protein